MRNIFLIMMMFLFPIVSYADYREIFYVNNVNITDYHERTEGYVFSTNSHRLNNANLTIQTNNSNQHITLSGKYADSVMVGNNNNIIKTPIPGLGLRISWATDSQSNISKYFPFIRTCVSPCQLQDEVTVEFIKIGTIKTGVMRRGTELATINLSQNVTNPEYLKIVLNEDIILQSRSCVLLDTDKYVELGNFTTDELKSIKYSPKYIDFNLTLQCDHNTTVGISYIGSATVNQNLKNNGTSDGVSILLHDENNSVVKIASTPTVNNYVTVVANENKPINLKTAVNVDDRRNIKSGTIEGNLFILLEMK